jgi:tetratricopeptide (TPR) repeat protein
MMRGSEISSGGLSDERYGCRPVPGSGDIAAGGIAASPRGPDSDGPARRLYAFLRGADSGYAICICDSPASRHDILVSLFPDLANCGVVILGIDMKDSATHIPGRIRAGLSESGSLPVQFRQVAVSLTGLEENLADAEHKPRHGRLRTLDYQWQTLDDFGHPILFWMSRWLFEIIRLSAPQFLKRRGLAVEFPASGDVRAKSAEERASAKDPRRRMALFRDRLNAEDDPRTKAGLLCDLAALHNSLNDLGTARKLYEQSLAIKQELGDKPGAVAIFGQLATISCRFSDYAEARRLVGLALALEEELGDKPGIARMLGRLAGLERTSGRLADAKAGYEKARLLCEELGDEAGVADMLNQLASLAENQKNYAEARVFYEQLLLAAERRDDKRAAARTMRRLAHVASRQGSHAEARELYERCLDLHRQFDDAPAVAACLRQFAEFAQLQGDYAEARRLCDLALDTERDIGSKQGIASTLSQLGQFAEIQKDERQALQRYLSALAVLRDATPHDCAYIARRVASMRRRLGNEAFRKLHDEVVAELAQPTAHS